MPKRAGRARVPLMFREVARGAVFALTDRMSIFQGRFGRSSLATLTALSLSLAWMATAPVARADVSPPDPQSCRDASFKPKAEGTACASGGKAGTCEYAETRISSSDALPDGGEPGRSIRCVDKNGSVLDLENGEEAVTTPTSGSDAGTPGTASKSKSSCAMTPAARAVGPWCLALIVPALAFGLRRRRPTPSK